MDPINEKFLDHFEIRVKVIEAKDLPDSNISSLVSIQIGEQQKYTRVIKNTNKPYFDEYFVFEIHTNFRYLLSTIVNISIFQPRKKFKVRKLIGCIRFDIGMVWSEPYHCLQKWLPVTVPSDVHDNVRGFLKCEFKIEAASSYSTYPDLELAGNMDAFEGKRARYRIKFYKCVGLKVQDPREASEVFIRVLFAGTIGSTTKRKLRDTVEWNEQIIFTEVFPPLFHKLSIEVVVGKSVLVSKHFYLLEILKMLKGSYQHIFGPNNVHLYKSDFLYCGTLLMAIETDIVGLFKQKVDKVTTMPMEPLSKEKCGDIENFLCFGVVFNAELNERKWGGSDIQLHLNFGVVGTYSSNETMNHPLTDCYKAVSGNSDFAYLPLNGKKPCVFVRSEWPDNSHRLFNSNMISNIAGNLRESVKLAQNLINIGNNLEAKNMLKLSTHELKKDCQKINQLIMRGGNELDYGRSQFLLTFLSNKLPQLASTCLQDNNLDIVLEKLNSLLKVVDILCEDIQDSLPFVIISLKKNQNIICSTKVHPRQIVFSKRDIKRGHDCGKIITVFLKTLSHKIIGRLDIWLWLGCWHEVSHCLQCIPPGVEDLSKMVYLPTTLTYDTFYIYTIYCRIFSGYIAAVSNSEGLCDTFVRVHCSNQSQQTKTVTKSLAPIWKETLVLSDINLYTTPAYIRENPPLLTLELWDVATKPSTLIGIELIRPSFSLQNIPSEIEFNLHWLKVGNKSQILSAFEMVQIQVDTTEPFNTDRLSSLAPKVLDPLTVPFRLEVVFWGIRPTSQRGFKQNTSQVQAIIQCSTSELKSSFITRTMTSLNFQHDLHILPLALPEVHIFSPPLILRILSNNIYVGCFVETNVHHYENQLPTKREWKSLFIQRKSLIDRAESRHDFHQVSMPDLIPLMEMDSKSQLSSNGDPSCGCIQTLKKLFSSFKLKLSKSITRVSISTKLLENVREEEENDWWFRYYSRDIIIYSSELENQKEFNGFNDVLKTFLIKEQHEEKSLDLMKVKVLMCLYRWPIDEELVTMEGQDPEMGVLKMTELKERVKLLVRVYCIKAYNLHPSDPNGLADPYIELVTASNCVSDKYNHISKQLNPVFGRCLEIPVTLPTDSILTIRVMDWDMFTASDLIGETIIDIENRFYSKHRATCGLSSTYTQTGHNAWRDIEKPTDILEKMCNNYNLPLPQYYDKSVLIGSKEFLMSKMQKDNSDIKEKLALFVLNNWNQVPIVGRALVPQHVETRSLFVNKKRGIEQGKLEMWVDLFDKSQGEIPPPVDISRRQPQSYELRVVILNTSKVPLVDDSFFVGRKHTDIFVKGWLWDPNDFQTTDVHYTSINGNGNFNWRFIFRFLYLRQEKRMVVYKKDIFSIGKNESNVPALLHLQVWDSDRLSANDFIGAMVLELYRMPRGALSVRTCKPKHFVSPTNTVDLFKVKRLRGWWPFFQMGNDVGPKGAGFVEAEIHLLTTEEASMNPAGLGRAAPNALPPPLRPEIRIKFWLAPIRAVVYLMCGVHRTQLILCACITATVLFILIGIYSVPFFIIKRILGA